MLLLSISRLVSSACSLLSCPTDYARSLEKYILKQGTWDTAGAGRDYDTYNFLDRVSGFKFDNSALEWTCQLRELLRNRTGEQHYLRPGDVWYRNPEFGKTVSDARKR
jgi:hypothetical protein